ncbi:MAG: outer membrane beta-barrel protein [Bacteroidaceae bacterium]|nr:outer membrane beta-barrel protein [Bacteroidaceae bacterium]
MRRIIYAGFLIALCCSPANAQDKQDKVKEKATKAQYYLYTKVCNAYTGEVLMTDPQEAKGEDKTKHWIVEFTDEAGNSMNDKITWSNQDMYGFKVPKTGGKYVLTIGLDGYETYHDTLDVKPFRHETWRFIPFILLKPLPKTHTLGETVITATKVKFTYKGDTLVYDADAFNTAEGSMLDALIRQLPGTELTDNGEIFVNGKKVESLLLNGEPFFRGDNQMMLENLPAYMVKNINVYNRPNEMSRLMGRNPDMEEYVMDVRLKKAYSIGWIGNVEAGAGSRERYLARLFALRFSDNSRLAIYANINNLNDNRKPGENTQWTPAQMPSGLLATKKGGFDYLVKEKFEKFRLEGNVEVSHTDADNYTETTSEDFISAGNQYRNKASSAKTRNWGFSTNHNIWYHFNPKTEKEIISYFRPYFNYNHFDRRNVAAGATFNRNPYDYCRDGIIDSIRTPGSSLMRQIALNRTIDESKSNGYNVNMNLPLSLTIPLLGEKIGVEGIFVHKASASNTFQKTLIDYPSATGLDEDYRNKYLHDSPNRTSSYSLKLGWEPHTPLMWGSLYYQYGQNFIRNNYEYNILSRLEDWNSQSDHALGELPSEVDFRLRTMDAENSFNLRETQSYHHVGANVTFALNSIEGKKYPYIIIRMPLTLRHNRLDYYRGNLTESVYDGITRKDFVLFNPSLHMHRNIKAKHYMLYAEFDYSLTQKAPQMTSLLEFERSEDPLNIYLGNSRLHKSSTHHMTLRLPFRFIKTKSILSFQPTYDITHNAIAYGYVYDPATGVRHYSPDNVNGNYQLALDINYTAPLDKNQLTTLTSTTHGHVNHGVDLIGMDDGSAPLRSSVYTHSYTERLRLDRKIGKHTIGAKAFLGIAHTSSSQDDFQSLTLYDFHYGLTSLLNLPLGLQLSTDLTMYSRRGYASSSANTNDLVWNARLSKTFTKAGLTFALDAFDILGNLSNISQVLNSQGRTETYRNSLPRYIMAHILYRLNKKPKK